MKLRFALMIGAAAIAGAAWPQMPGLTLTPKSTLAIRAEVKAELKISKDQEKKIMSAIQETGKKMQAGGVASLDMSNLYKPIDDAVLGELDDVQKKRLDELYLQFNGAAALRMADRAAQFGLTDDQKAAIRPINKQLDDEYMAILQKPGRDSVKKQDEARKKANDQILEKLTPEQREAWTKALGAEFKFKS